MAATSRCTDELKNAVQPTGPDHFLRLQEDLGDEASVRQALETTVQTFGGIDVVVNNAGYGQLEALEELTDQEARQNFDVNVFEHP